MQVKEQLDLEQELAGLKTRVEHLETKVRREVDKHGVEPPKPGEPLDYERLMAWLRAEGLIREPTPEERRLAAEWDALSEEEKQEIRWELDHLPPGPMASDIIIKNRR